MNNRSINFDYFYETEQENFTFLQMPIALIRDPKFNKISGDTKILYSLLLQRTSLSRANGWIDEEKRVFIIYSIKEIMADLNCWEQKAVKMMNDLKEIGLIKTFRRMNKSSIIYVMKFATDYKYNIENKKDEKQEPKTPILPLSCENHNTANCDFHNTANCENHNTANCENHNLIRPTEFRPTVNKKIPQVRKKLTLERDNKINVKSSPAKKLKKKTNINNDFDNDIDFITDKEPVINQTANKTTSNAKQDNPMNNIPVYDYDTYKAIIHKNISYNHFKQHSNAIEIRMIDELVENMLDVITTQRKTIQINSETKERQIVINKYLSLHANDIKHVLMKYQEQEGKITHVSAYLKTLLYTVKQEANFFYDNHFKSNGMI